MREYGIGQSVPRTEDIRFIQGRGRYTDDFDIPGAVHLFVVRSPHPRARIVSIDKRAALAAPGVLAVLTGEDAFASGLESFKSNVRKPGPGGQPNVEPPYPVLARGEARFVGDPVAAVIATTLLQAKDAAEQLSIEYAPLPAAADLASASRHGAPEVWADCPGNLCVLTEVGRRGATERAFAAAAHVVRHEIVISRVTAAPMEPRAAIAEYDAREDRYVLRAGMQGPHVIRAELSRVLAIPEKKLRVIAPDVGGAFGMKGMPHPELALVLWATREVGQPVRWVAERTESFLGDQHARDNRVEAELALDGNGKFRAFRVRTAVNLGAYLSATGIHCAINNLGGIAGVYEIPALHAEVRAYFSHSSPTSAYRGAGRPEASTMIETTIDKAAHLLGIDPAELRLRNLIAPQDMPYDTRFVFKYDSGDFDTNQRRAMAMAGWESFAERKAASAARGRLRGRGMAHVIESAGGIADEMAEIRFEQDGSAVVTIGTHSQGQGHETALRQLVTGMLGVTPERVSVRFGDTDLLPFGRGAGGSRVAIVASHVLRQVADRIIDKGRQIAAGLLEAAPEDLEFEAGGFRIAGTDRQVTLADVARASFQLARVPQGGEPGLGSRVLARTGGATFPNGCHICEVEIDEETGVVEVMGYWVVEDVGRMINPAIVKGQVQGGVAQGIGQALGESIAYGEDGQLLTASFMDYAMPRADNLCMIEVASNEVPTPTNALGVKGAGEGGTVGALPATMNAVCDALRARGIECFEMPATPLRVFRALKQTSRQP